MSLASRIKRLEGVIPARPHSLPPDRPDEADYVAVLRALNAVAENRGGADYAHGIDLERGTPFGARLGPLELRAYNDLLPYASVIYTLHRNLCPESGTSGVTL